MIVKNCHLPESIARYHKKTQCGHLINKALQWQKSLTWFGERTRDQRISGPVCFTVSANQEVNRLQDEAGLNNSEWDKSLQLSVERSLHETFTTPKKKSITITIAWVKKIMQLTQIWLEGRFTEFEPTVNALWALSLSCYIFLPPYTEPALTDAVENFQT